LKEAPTTTPLPKNDYAEFTITDPQLGLNSHLLIPLLLTFEFLTLIKSGTFQDK